MKFFLKPDVKVLNIRGITALKHILPLAWALTLTLPAFSSELSVCETGGDLPVRMIRNRDILPSGRPDSVQTALEVVKGFLRKDSARLLPDPELRKALECMLYFFENGPVDSVISYLDRYPYKKIYSSDKLIADTTYVIHTDTLYLPAGDIAKVVKADTLKQPPGRDTLLKSVKPILPAIRDSVVLLAMDTTHLAISDSLAAMFHTVPDSIRKRMELREVREVKLTYDTITVVDPVKQMLTDSLKRSLDLLFREMLVDSTGIWIKNIADDSLRVWLSDRQRNFFRFWVKNEARDSIGLWLEGIDGESFRLIMDEGVYIGSLSNKKHIDKVDLERKIDETLKKMTKVKVTEPPWTMGAVTSLQFSQGYLSYWAKGGESSVSTLLHLEGNANYSKGKSKWENSAQIKSGILQSGEKGLRKNEDLFEINSSYGEKIIKNWYLSVLGNLKSQFFKGYDYKDTTVVSNFLAPGYLLLSLGMDYKPHKDFSLLISPLTSKTTIVRDLANVNPVKYGLEAGQRVKREMGGYVKTRYKANLFEGVSMENKLDLFTSYTNKPQNIDINWETIVRMKINLYMEANISSHLIYDDDVDIPVVKEVNGETVKTTTKKVQFKELLSVGFRYRF